MTRPRIAVIGSLNIDIVVETDRFPQVGETILGSKVSYVPGGKGANQAVASARLGAETYMIGAIGDDSNGRMIRAALEQEQIRTETLKVVNSAATGIASIVSSNKNNQIVVVPGANSMLTPEDIEQARPILEKTDIALVQLEIPLETVAFAVDYLKKLGIKVILNPAPARELPIHTLQSADYLTPNESEIEFLTGTQLKPGDLPHEAMEMLINQGVNNVITTLGSNGAAYRGKDGSLFHIPGYPMPVKDTTGAGDAFNAGFAYSLHREQDPIKAIQFANRVAALSVTRYGAQAGMPYLQEVIQFS